jgi:hypothetical protein
MKTKLRLLCLGAMVIGLSQMSVFGQTDQQIKRIRADVKRINLSLTRYVKTTKDIDDISAEGALATYYSSKTAVRKIFAQVYGESGKSETTLYYKNNYLIFAYEKTSRYDIPIGATMNPKVANVREERVYFANGEPIKILVSESLTKPNDQWEKAKANVLESDKIFRKAMKN